LSSYLPVCSCPIEFGARELDFEFAGELPASPPLHAVVHRLPVAARFYQSSICKGTT
jgi:hypothetical protein